MGRLVGCRGPGTNPQQPSQVAASCLLRFGLRVVSARSPVRSNCQLDGVFAAQCHGAPSTPHGRPVGALVGSARGLFSDLRVRSRTTDRLESA